MCLIYRARFEMADSIKEKQKRIEKQKKNSNIINIIVVITIVKVD